MPSNALSQKKFSTKTPAICHPPPWPPAIPIPPIQQATFFCFASLQYDYYGTVADFACSSILRYYLGYWHGKSIPSDDPTIAHTYTKIWPSPLQPVYHILVDYYWDTHYHRQHIWMNNSFPPERPYVGKPVETKSSLLKLRAYCAIREIPP